MATGLDYSAGVISPAAIVAAGHTFVIRYVEDPALGLSAKHITAAEYAALTAAGLRVFLVFEADTTDITDGPGGNPEGVAHAHRAAAGAAAVGYPRGLPIFFACDEHLTAAQVTVGMQYLDGAATGLAGTGWLLGAYGFAEFVSAAQAGRRAAVFWQCGHDPGPAAGVHLWQRNDIAPLPVLGGVPCDVNVAYLPVSAVPKPAEDNVNIPIVVAADGTFRGVVNAECGDISACFSTGYISWSSSWGATVWTVSCQGDDGHGNTHVLPGQVVNQTRAANTRSVLQMPPDTVKVTVEGRLVDKAAVPSALWVPVPK